MVRIFLVAIFTLFNIVIANTHVLADENNSYATASRYTLTFVWDENSQKPLLFAYEDIYQCDTTTKMPICSAISRASQLSHYYWLSEVEYEENREFITFQFDDLMYQQLTDNSKHDISFGEVMCLINTNKIYFPANSHHTAEITQRLINTASLFLDMEDQLQPNILEKI